MIVGGAGFLAGTVAVPASDSSAGGAASTFTLASLGVGAAGFAVAGVIIVLTAPEEPVKVRVGVAPGRVAVSGGF
jgi:hypothetical protein